MLTIFMLAVLPLSANEPAVEPYLTSPPFNLSVPQVGLFFLICASFDMVMAGVAAGVVQLIGHIAALYLAPLISVTGNILVGVGPQTYGVFLLSFGLLSLGMMPVFVASSALLMRVCRTYDLDPKAYAEYISAMVMGTLTLSMGIFGAISGPLVQVMGFRHFVLLGAGFQIIAPIAVYIGYNEKVMGRPLAPRWEDTEEGKEEARKKEEDAQAAKKAAEEKKRLKKEEKAMLKAEKASQIA